jgi:hypothetical protein
MKILFYFLLACSAAWAQVPSNTAGAPKSIGFTGWGRIAQSGSELG